MIGGLKISIKPPKANKTVRKKAYTKVSRKTVGKVEVENGKFVIRVSAFEVKRNIEKSSLPAQLVLPLTDKSFELKGREKVFSRLKGEHGYVCYLRTKERANLFPGIPEQYTTVAPNWMCSGYVVRIKGKLYFDLGEAIAPESTIVGQVHFDED